MSGHPIDDAISQAGAQLQQLLFGKRDPSKPSFDHTPGNDLHPDASKLAFRLQLVEGQLAAALARLAGIENVIREAQKNARSNSR